MILTQHYLPPARMGSGDDWDDNLDKLKERQRKKRRGYVLLHLHKKIMEEANKKSMLLTSLFPCGFLLSWAGD